jgi:dTDP-4-dehydrorhamnose reductase
MQPSKVLITGATGMLGSRIFRLLQTNSFYQVFSIGRSNIYSNHIACDIADISAFANAVNKISPDYIIHCAANVNIENCEQEKDYAYKLHVLTSRVIASRKDLKKSIFISTDSVFDGRKGGYKEDDFVAPLNYYALTKALAEACFSNACHPSLTLRTNMFGFNNPMKKSLFEWAWSSLNHGKEISGYSNVYFNPLYVGTIAKIVVDMLRTDVMGVLHIGCNEGLSKYDFIERIADIFDLSKHLVKPSIAQDDGLLKRPLNTTLNVDLFQQKSGSNLPSIDMELMTLARDFKPKN